MFVNSIFLQSPQQKQPDFCNSNFGKSNIYVADLSLLRVYKVATYRLLEATFFQVELAVS